MNIKKSLKEQQKALKSAQRRHLKMQSTLNARGEGEASQDKLALNHLSYPSFPDRSVASVVKSPAQADCLNIHTASLMILQPH